MSDGRSFQTQTPEIENALRPIVDRR